MTPSPNLNRFNKLDWELRDALLDSNGDEEAIKAAIKGKTKNDIRLACDHLLSSADETKQRKSDRARLLITISQVSSATSVLELLWREVTQKDTLARDWYDGDISGQVGNLIAEKDTQAREKKKQKK
ncbi:MAG: hypothetical protein HOG89_04375 [Candidatus Peribacter sp.]|jgi:hypothetical protein|nr:hypothetical protein [Candidatus Peribacter sp.]MBT4393403.1 hypothetical protein [Candidatus Peribacter sp.]MBT4600758.1 hypothetical protein [Candidatus Peribacter sp.]MBT5149196.1 hypothetical protein [Candidatus Peribacter sp.]MBT5637831.1 hypothetical protein [Candidatus Peribacter sp.]